MAFLYWPAGSQLRRLGKTFKLRPMWGQREPRASEPGLYDLTPTFELLCEEWEPPEPGPPRAARPANSAAQPVPERSEWYVEPVKVFDNLFNVGTSFYVWAITTSEGIILLNSGRDYAAEAVVEGLEKMGLDPANVKYIIIHTPDVRHYGAAKFFQDRLRFADHAVGSRLECCGGDARSSRAAKTQERPCGDGRSDTDAR